MPRRSVCAVGLILAMTVGCLHAPVLWSPDGQWLAYTIAVRSEPKGLAPGWLFETNRPLDADLSHAAPGRRPPIGAYRLWATRVETGASVLLEESRGPLTSPAWSPDGKRVAFGRLVQSADGNAQFEVVVQEALDRRRVIFSRPYREFSEKAADLPGLALAWSPPDGRYLAVPLFQQSLGLAIIRADNGRLLKLVEDAYLPSWSPDGTKLAFIRGTDPESLNVIDTNFGPPRHLADIGQTTQAPVWTRTGRSLVVAARTTAQPNGGPPTQQDVLNRVEIDTGKVETIATLTADPIDREKSFNGSSFSFDRDGENLFYVSDIENQPTVVTWFRPSNREVYKKFHPIDFSIRMGALALSPDGKTLAFRAGPPGYLTPPATWDLTVAPERPTEQRLTPIVPDDSARVEWLFTMVNASRQLLRGVLPFVTGGAVDRATLLPVPGEFPSNHEVLTRLRRLGKIGRALCERPAAAPPPSPALRDLLTESRLFFDYLSQDYDAALTSLDTLEAETTDADRRVRLMSVRAQIFLGLGQADRAKETIAFLQSIQPAVSRSWESTPTGPTVTTAPDPKQGWLEYLVRQCDKLATATNQGADAPGPLNPAADAADVGGVAPFAPQLLRALPPMQGIVPPEIPRIEAPPVHPMPSRPAPPLLPRFQRPRFPRPAPPPPR